MVAFMADAPPIARTTSTETTRANRCRWLFWLCGNGKTT
jgi:hypothetical protein